MTTIINGTDNSATTPAITGGTGGTGTGLFYPASNQVALATNGTTAVTINTSQNVGVGMTDQTKKLETTGTLATRGSSTNATWTGAGELAIKNGSGNSYMSFHGDTGTRLSYMQTSVTATELNAETGYLAFATNVERMRILANGNVSVGTTSDIARIGAVFDGNSNNGCVLRTSTNASGAGFLYFQQDTNTCGSVVRVGTTSAVTYSSTSDYRLKENVVPMTDGLDKVARLKPVTYTWKQGGENAEGFIAHELAEVCPDAVVGTKDQVETYLDDEGNKQTRPKYQSIDTSFLVATLTAAIQELNAKVDAQAAEIQALKANP